MKFTDLRQFIRYLEANSDLVRIREEVDSDQEITIIQHRVLDNQGPALLFENVKGSPYKIVTNLFGTPERVSTALGGVSAMEIGEQIACLADQFVPPSVSGLWRSRKTLWRLTKARMKNVRSGPILQKCFCPPELTKLPCLKCWPLDGGAFFTLPLVYTIDPVTGRGNLGIYRLQRYDDKSTGMHWQIEKGGGFHFHQAFLENKTLPVSVFLGGPPALTFAAIAPLPEGIDERLLAALIMGTPLEVIRRSVTGHQIPATAEFVMEGSVAPSDTCKEGPFGDHLGHYSHSADFPVFRVDRLLARKDAIYPATVVGKPPQEDYFIGEALQEMMSPLLKMVKPGISNIWAYPETGFHPMAVVAVKQRYKKEALKHAMSILGEGQLSLTKVLIIVDHNIDVRNFREVSNALWKNFDSADSLYILAPSFQDTLDFTGSAMNMGSRLVLLATENDRSPSRCLPEKPPLPGDVHKDIIEIRPMGKAFLMIKTNKLCNKIEIQQALIKHSVTGQYIFHVLVSDDVPFNDLRLMLWGWFTRFDPLSDIHPSRREQKGNRLILHTPIMIDATWKEGYRKPVEFDLCIQERVNNNWDKYGINMEF